MDHRTLNHVAAKIHGTGPRLTKWQQQQQRQQQQQQQHFAAKLLTGTEFARFPAKMK